MYLLLFLQSIRNSTSLNHKLLNINKICAYYNGAEWFVSTTNTLTYSVSNKNFQLCIFQENCETKFNAVKKNNLKVKFKNIFH